MTKFFAAALAVSALLSTSAFADSLTIGKANTAPVFAVQSGNASIVSDIGNASTAPVYALKSGTGSVVADLGSANRAPVFAQVRTQNATVALAQ